MMTLAESVTAAALLREGTAGHRVIETLSATPAREHHHSDHQDAMPGCGLLFLCEDGGLAARRRSVYRENQLLLAPKNGHDFFARIHSQRDRGRFDHVEGAIDDRRRRIADSADAAPIHSRSRKEETCVTRFRIDRMDAQTSGAKEGPNGAYRRQDKMSGCFPRKPTFTKHSGSQPGRIGKCQDSSSLSRH